MANKYLILLVEDESNIASFITTVLRANQYEVKRAATGEEALMMASSYCPDLIILDLGLPDIDGQKVLSTVRSWTQTPVIVVSARSHERDKVESLDLGADDYITKPFGTSELLARVRTALRHSQNRADINASGGVFRAGKMRIDYDKRRVTVDGADVHLTQTEYNIVALLSRHAGRVLTYDFVMRETWGPRRYRGQQPDFAREYGEYPPQAGKEPCGAGIYFYGDRRRLPDAGRGKGISLNGRLAAARVFLTAINAFFQYTGFCNYYFRRKGRIPVGVLFCNSRSDKR